MEDCYGFTPTLPSHAKAPGGLDDLKLPDGRTIGEVPTPELTGALVALGVGATHTAGRLANVEAYAAHLASIRQAGADAAEAAWMAAHQGVTA